MLCRIQCVDYVNAMPSNIGNTSMDSFNIRFSSTPLVTTTCMPLAHTKKEHILFGAREKTGTCNANYTLAHNKQWVLARSLCFCCGSCAFCGCLCRERVPWNLHLISMEFAMAQFALFRQVVDFAGREPAQKADRIELVPDPITWY